MPFDPADLTRTVRVKLHLCGCGCWVWTGATNPAGYAGVKMRGQRVLAHRYAYERLIGPIPPEMTIDHLCDRHRNCLNPAHMEAVTGSENSIRANKRRFHDDAPDRSLCTDPSTSTDQPTSPESATDE